MKKDLTKDINVKNLECLDEFEASILMNLFDSTRKLQMGMLYNFARTSIANAPKKTLS